ncbi:MAG: tetratricopeptide repeat protein, partial [Gammaproteobacteria bacterium]|nr:tetratricopeptide repeat protein [Gammaproteobacteria bacterium]
MAPKTAANPMMEKMHKALAYQKAGEFAKAQKIYKLVLKKLPDNADANHLLGVTYRQLGDPETAIKYIEKAIKLSPGQGVFYSNLARAHSDIPASGPEAILENAEKALLLNPNIVEA